MLDYWIIHIKVHKSFVVIVVVVVVAVDYFANILLVLV